VHAYGHDAADRWLLKDDTEANEVMESGNEFHSVIVLAAKDVVFLQTNMHSIVASCGQTPFGRCPQLSRHQLSLLIQGDNTQIQRRVDFSLEKQQQSAHENKLKQRVRHQFCHTDRCPNR